MSALNQSIIEAYHSSCPLKTTTKSRSCSWWSSRLLVLRKTVRKLFNKAKRPANWEEYKSSLTAYNKGIRTAKQKSFRKFCKSVSSTFEAASLHKTLAKAKTDTVLAIKRSDGTYTSSAEKRATALLLTHFP